MSLQNKHCCWLLGCPGPPESGGRQRGVSRPPPPWAGLSRPMAPEAGHPCGHPEPQKSPSVVPEGGLAPGRGWVSMGWPWWPGGARPDPTLASLPRAGALGGQGGGEAPPLSSLLFAGEGPRAPLPGSTPRPQERAASPHPCVPAEATWHVRLVEQSSASPFPGVLEPWPHTGFRGADVGAAGCPLPTGRVHLGTPKTA